MRKLRNYAMLGLIGLLGTITIGVANADTQVIHYPDSNVQYTLNGSENFTAGTITITDSETTITILDRNLGATAAGTGCEGNNCPKNDPTYGYHFQRGNNWGFDPNSSPSISSTLVQVSSITYNPSQQQYYSSPIFISRFGVGNWLNTDSVIDLWGGSTSDNISISSLNGDNRKVTNSEQRKGPCPEGFHIPSDGELKKITSMMGNENNIHTQLLIPFAGKRRYNYADVYDLGEEANLRSSSPFSTNNPYSSYLRMSVAGYFSFNNTEHYRISAYSLRCIYDSYETYTKASNLLVSFWTGEDTSVAPACSGQLASGEVISGDLLTCVEGLSSTKERYSLSGRRDVESDAGYNTGDAVTTGLNLVAKWKAENFSITYDLDGGALEAGSTNPGSYTIESDDITLVNPNKEGYTFAGWTGTDLDSATITVTIASGSTGDREYYATWTANPKPVSHGGGGSTLRKDNCPNGDYSDSYYDGICGEKPESQNGDKGNTNNEEDSSSQSSSEGQKNYELQTAYEFAYENKITTMDTIEEADMMGNLTRIAMAKMLSKYAINVLGKKPANKIVPSFTDITEELNAEYDYGVSLAYQLGIMGINMPENKFRPFDKVTRAEFVTALSRLLYDTEDGKILYYSTHMELLNKMGIITVTDPDMEELRGYVMLMLMRSAK